jgi:hypothetical protein
MVGIGKSFFVYIGVLAAILLFSPLSSFAMDEDKKDLNKSFNKSFIKQNSPEKFTEKELEFKKYVDEQRDAMKQASKRVNKKLKLNHPKKTKNYK